MKLNSLEKLYNSLKFEWPTVEVDDELRKKAVLPINEMLRISAENKL